TLASIYAQEEQYDKAVQYLDRLIAETKTDKAEVYGLLGQIQYNAGNYPEAVAAVKRALELEKEKPDDSWQQILMASYHEMGDEDAALTLAEEQYRKDPTDKRAMLNLVTLYSQMDQSQKAIALMEEARAKNMLTEQRDYEILYAAYLNSEGGEAKAAAVIQEGLDKGLLPADAKTYTYLGQAYYFSDQIEPAIGAFRQAAAAAKDGEPGPYLSQPLSNEDRQGEAKAAAQAALAKGLKKPGEAWMVIGRSEFYMDNLPAVPRRPAARVPPELKTRAATCMSDKNYYYRDQPQGISWARIGGNAFAIALHAVVFMLMMAPVNPPGKEGPKEEVTLVSFI